MTSRASMPPPAFGNPADFSLVFDQPLLDRLFRTWRQCYLRKRTRKTLLRLFRALEVAFHATLFPADGLTSINDVGTRITLWVSAFEVLCHPGGGVNKRHVQKVISDAPFSDKTLTSTRFTVSLRRKQVSGDTTRGALRRSLPGARNQFLHGMPVRPRRASLSSVERLHRADRRGASVVQCRAGLTVELTRCDRCADGFQQAHDEDDGPLHEEPRGHQTSIGRAQGRGTADRMNPAARIRQPE